MTPDQFRDALKTLGLSAREYARLSGRPVSTVQNWTRANSVRIPDKVAAWLARRLADLARDPAP
jgi:DNA-binding transcriptional regulator YiaG